jgi:hypothetical protein
MNARNAMRHQAFCVQRARPRRSLFVDAHAIHMLATRERQLHPVCACYVGSRGTRAWRERPRVGQATVLTLGHASGMHLAGHHDPRDWYAIVVVSIEN